MSKKEMTAGPFAGYVGRIGGVLLAFAVLMTVLAASAGSNPSSPEIAWFPDTLYQGALMRLEVSFPHRAEGLSGDFLGRELHVYRDDDQANRWIGFIGIDIDQEPGPVYLTLRTKDDVFTSKVHILEKGYGVRRLEIKEKEPDPQTLERIREESELLEALWIRVDPTRFWRESFLRPIPGKLTGEFGVRTYINGNRRSPHSGVDFRAQKNENVICSNDGRVALVRDLYYSGISVFVDHGHSLYTMYFHLERPLVRQGDRIRRGEVVGKAGSTGRSTGVHLHWGARLNGARIDPLQLLDRSHMLSH
ncbi:MAG: M23 family metallopeptidase [Deltaproteobacteria bacterium]|nr:M23 family metallopeptidase [Deltaproteobacteria bacterium]